MSFLREKRLLLGWLALGAPLPLPLNQVLEWPALFLFLAVILFFLRRAEDPAFNPLTNRLLNVVGLIYLPFLGFDLWLGASRGQMVPALLHMLLFVLAVKLFAIRQEKDKWQVLLAIFFVFVASMATSSHVTVALGDICTVRFDVDGTVANASGGQSCTFDIQGLGMQKVTLTRWTLMVSGDAMTSDFAGAVLICAPTGIGTLTRIGDGGAT